MKKMFLIFFVLAFSFESSFALEVLSNNMEQKLVRFYSDFDKTLIIRTKAVKFYDKIRNPKEEDTRLSAIDLQSIHLTMNKYIKNRKSLLKYIEKYEYLGSSHTEIELTNKKTKVKKSWKPVVYFPFYVKTQKIKLNPEDKQGRKLLLNMQMAIASALALYDNYLVAISPYQSDSGLRRIINDDNIKQKNILEKITSNFKDHGNFKKISRILTFYKKFLNGVSSNKYPTLLRNKNHKFLQTVIEGSYTYQKINTIGFMDRIVFRVGFVAKYISDLLFSTQVEVIDGISKVFGNSVGLIQTRSGKMKKLSLLEKEEIQNTLKSLDIVLEKTPFRLTDKFIPGHFGHVALWIGTQKELEEIGVWDELYFLNLL